MLGRHVAAQAGRPGHGQVAGHVDDGAAVAQVGHDVFEAEEGGPEVGADDVVEGVLRIVGQLVDGALDVGVVEEQVDAAEAPPGVGDVGDDVGRAGDVADERLDPGELGAEGGQGLGLGLGGVARQGAHLPALGQEAVSHGAPLLASCSVDGNRFAAHVIFSNPYAIGLIPISRATARQPSPASYTTRPTAPAPRTDVGDHRPPPEVVQADGVEVGVHPGDDRVRRQQQTPPGRGHDGGVVADRRVTAPEALDQAELAGHRNNSVTSMMASVNEGAAASARGALRTAAGRGEVV